MTGQWLLQITNEHSASETKTVTGFDESGHQVGVILQQVKMDCIGFGTRLPPGREPGPPFKAHGEIGSEQKGRTVMNHVE